MTASSAPSGLGPRGRKLWKAATAEFEVTSPSDVVILEQAARQLDNIGALEDLLAEQGLVIEGSRGQSRLNPLVGELRQGRLAFVKLVDALTWPLEDGDEAMSPASRRAAKAANARWGRVKILEEQLARGRLGDASA